MSSKVEVYFQKKYAHTCVPKRNSWPEVLLLSLTRASPLCLLRPEMRKLTALEQIRKLNKFKFSLIYNTEDTSRNIFQRV